MLQEDSGDGHRQAIRRRRTVVGPGAYREILLDGTGVAIKAAGRTGTSWPVPDLRSRPATRLPLAGDNGCVV